MLLCWCKSMTSYAGTTTQLAQSWIDHQFLLNTLHFIGLEDTSLSWFSSYLSDCKFNVSFASSTSLSLTFGVPQGSVLGPFLISLYIAPIRQTIDLAFSTISTLMTPSYIPLTVISSLHYCKIPVNVCQQSVTSCPFSPYLKLNIIKTYLFVFPSSTNLCKHDIFTSVCGTAITTRQHVRCLGDMFVRQSSQERKDSRLHKQVI